MRTLLTIDVEDWFQAENLKKAINRNNWDSYQLRVYENIKRILDLLDANYATATFFVLGWVAERFPKMIKEIHKGNHEIASHGYWHKLINNQNIKEFSKDIEKSKKILEDIIGEEVIGYRAPSFSISDEAIEILKEKGYKYDSSYCRTALNKKYGTLSLNKAINDAGVYHFSDGFIEVPITTLRFLNIQIPAGGAYFRILPYTLFKIGLKLLNNQPLVFYLHPWEIDYMQPRLKRIGILNRFKHYTQLKSTFKKLEKLIQEYRSISLREYLTKYIEKV